MWVNGQPIRSRVLTKEELTTVRNAFLTFDRDGSGAIDLNELREGLEEMGNYMDDEQFTALVREIDSDNSGLVEFEEFLGIVEQQKRDLMNHTGEADSFQAWIALGGRSDGSGFVERQKIENVVQEYGLIIDIERLCDELDQDKNGELDYEEFKQLFAKSYYESPTTDAEVDALSTEHAHGDTFK